MKIPLSDLEFCAFCGYVKSQCECEKPQTNADRIRSMSDEELAEFLDNYRPENIANEWCPHLCPDRKDGDCDCPYGGYETALGWLKSKVNEKTGGDK